jgi:hypothetical protein
MSEEKALKTLANCSAIEGLKQINKIRAKVNEYYDLIGVDAIKEKYRTEAQNADKSEAGKMTKRFLDDIFNAALDVNAEKTIEIVGMLAFMDAPACYTLTLDEAYAIITECMKSQAVMDFFSSAVKSVTNGTETT